MIERGGRDCELKTNKLRRNERKKKYLKGKNKIHKANKKTKKGKTKKKQSLNVKWRTL